MTIWWLVFGVVLYAVVNILVVALCTAAGRERRSAGPDDGPRTGPDSPAPQSDVVTRAVARF
ncbi:MAG: pilus assembly PilX N-terminal domain-containing protein [Thermoleophilia bacterium]|nr:pilus assembly PilX N-terminal domain-containing protein [Thermoleophilia bacterium]